MKICPLMSFFGNKVPCMGDQCAVFDEDGNGCGFTAKLPDIVQQKLRDAAEQPSDCTYSDLFPPDYDACLGE